jgi:oligoendopeptidase F
MDNQREVTWDLTDLFSSVTSTDVDEAITKVVDLGNAFEERYRGRITSLKPQTLLVCLHTLEAFEEKMENISLYASLSFSADMTSIQNQALNDRVNKLEARLGKQLAFFQLELGVLVEANPHLVDDTLLSNYRHMLERVRRRVLHQLSEVEEQLIIEKDQFGVNAWQELQSKWLNTRNFEVTILGTKKKLSYGEANGLLSHPDRATRESANCAIRAAW